jgi:hypothetical protein
VFGEDHQAATQGELRSQFAPGQFLAPGSDDEALTAPAFVPLKAGVELLPAPAEGAQARPAGLAWEERVIARGIPKPAPGPTGFLVDISALEIVLSAMSVRDSGWWPVPDEVVAVDPVAPVMAAFAWSMAPAPEMTAANELELAQAVAEMDELMTVEAWEVVR